MMNISHSWARASVAVALTLLAGAGNALDLVESYDKALASDPRQRAADEALAAGREKAVQGRSLWLPQVALSANLNRVDQKSSSDLPPALNNLLKPDSSGTVRQVAIQAVQPLVDARAAADKRQLEQQTALAEIRHREATQDLMQRVSQAYFSVLLASENLRVVQAEKAAIGLQRERAQARFEVGRGKVTDVEEAQARLDAVTSREVAAQSTLALRQAQFAELTGVPAQGLAGLRAGFLPTQPQPDNLAAWQQKGLDQNPLVQVRRSELAIAEAETRKYALSARPTLELVASIAHKGQNGSLSPLVSPDSSRTAVIGLQLNVPLYTGGALDSRQRESMARQRQAEQDLQAAQRDVRLQVQDAFLSVKTGASRVQALQQSVRSAQSALEATTLGRDVGTRTELDVLDAQQRLFNAQLDLAQARNDYLLGRIRLAAAGGELQATDLQALNAYLDRQNLDNGAF